MPKLPEAELREWLAVTARVAAALEAVSLNRASSEAAIRRVMKTQERLTEALEIIYEVARSLRDEADQVTPDDWYSRWLAR